MKTVYRIIAVFIGSLLMSLIAMEIMPADNFIFEIIVEKPSLRTAIILIVFVFFIVGNYVSFAIMNFVCSVFYKVGSKDKEKFELHSAQINIKTILSSSILLNGLCIAVKVWVNDFVYIAAYLTGSLLLFFFFISLYQKKENDSINMFIASIPFVVYTIVYTACICANY